VRLARFGQILVLLTLLGCGGNSDKPESITGRELPTVTVGPWVAIIYHDGALREAQPGKRIQGKNDKIRGFEYPWQELSYAALLCGPREFILQSTTSHQERVLIPYTDEQFEGWHDDLRQQLEALYDKNRIVSCIRNELTIPFEAGVISSTDQLEPDREPFEAFYEK
jgi:hypothetical protein